MGLFHESRGEGKKRVVTVMKNPVNDVTIETESTETTPTIQNPDSQSTLITTKSSEESDTSKDNPITYKDNGDSTHNIKQHGATPTTTTGTSTTNGREYHIASSSSSCTSNLWKCPLCGYVIPEINKDLHEMRCVREQRKIEEEKKAKTQTKKIEKAKGRDIDRKLSGQMRKKENSKSLSTKAKHDDEDLDSLIAEMKATDSTCRYPGGCRKSVSMLGTKCEFCSNKFCMSHSIPEVHGCGLEAKRKAREKMMREAQSRERGFVGGKTMDSTKRKQLQRKLDSKIEDLSNERQREKKETQKK